MGSLAEWLSPSPRGRARPVILNYSEGPDEAWHFYEGLIDPGELEWVFFHSLPRRPLERVDNPKVVRYFEASRAAWYAARNQVDVVVSHGPLLAWWYEEMSRLMKPGAAHLAFAFNFVTLPRGGRARAMRRAFRAIDKFVVYSTVERELYADYFEIPIERIDMRHWAVRSPEPSREARARGVLPYVCAIGGNGRDYATLMRAAAIVPEVPFLCVARPENLVGLRIPSNVQVECNVSNQRALDILHSARFMVCPLSSSEVPCGHVSLVNAMHMRKALIITDSRGIHDYAFHGETALRVPHKDAASMAEAICRLWQDASLCQMLSDNAYVFAKTYCDESQMVRYVRDYFVSKGLLSPKWKREQVSSNADEPSLVAG